MAYLCLETKGEKLKKENPQIEEKGFEFEERSGRWKMRGKKKKEKMLI